MSDDGKTGGGEAARDRRKSRGQRASAVIEASAVDVTPPDVLTSESTADQDPQAGVAQPEDAGLTTGEPAEPVLSTTARDDAEAPAEPAMTTLRAQEQANPEQPAKVDETPTAEAQARAPDPVIAPPPPRSIAGPLAAAAIAGGLLGTAGGVLVPGFLGVGKAPDTTAELTRLRQQITALESRPATGGASVNLDPVNQRIAAIEADAQKRVAEAEKRQADRIASLEVAVRAAAARPAVPGQPAPPAVDLTPLTTRLQSLEDGLKTVDGKADAATRATVPQIATLQASVQDAAQMAAAVQPAIAALATKVEQATRKVEAGAVGPLFAATQGLAQAFHRGQGFLLELDAVEALGGDPALLSSLKPFAEKGAPTIEALGKAFAPLAHAAATAGLPAEDGAMGFVKRFIKIRPSGEVGGESQPSLVATIEAALAKGQTEVALAAWRRLPEEARRASATWAASAEAREKAAAGLKQLQDGVLARLRSSRP